MFYYLLLFCLSCSGFTWIVTRSKIFKPVRDFNNTWFWKNLLNCSACTGFHVGWISFLIFYYSNIILFPNIIAGMWLFGCISSIVSYIIDRIVNDWGINLVINKEGE